MRFVVLLLLALLGACGESPLFNHEIEKSFSSRSSFAQEAEEFHFQSSELSFRIEWTEPPRMGESKFLLKIWNSKTGSANGPYQDPTSKLHVFLWMPSMGHGSSPVKINRTAAGEYEVTNVYFIMGGQWELKFQLLSNGKVSDETVLSYSL